MKFLNPACLINKLRRSHSKKAYEQLVHEDHDQTQRTTSKKKHGLSPKGSTSTFDVFVGKESKKYPVPHEYLSHPKLQELINKYREFVLDPRSSDPIVLECSTETFEQYFLRSIVKNR
ncbi:hypothetical protein ACLB2K_045803 [Fragaria x ananassa]